MASNDTRTSDSSRQHSQIAKPSGRDITGKRRELARIIGRLLAGRWLKRRTVRDGESIKTDVDTNR